MATSRKGGGAKPPPPHDVPKPPAPRPVASATKPPPVAGGGKTSQKEKEGKVAISKKQKVSGLILVGVLLSGAAIWYGFFRDKPSQTVPTTVQAASAPVAPATQTPPAPPSAPAVAQPAPVVVAPTPPAAPAPTPTLSAEEVDKRIAALTDGDEVKSCLTRLKGWGVDISTSTSFDSEATNCRQAVAAK